MPDPVIDPTPVTPPAPNPNPEPPKTQSALETNAQKAAAF